MSKGKNPADPKVSEGKGEGAPGAGAGTPPAALGGPWMPGVKLSPGQSKE